MTEYAGLIRALQLPPGFAPPTRLEHGELRARVLTRADLSGAECGAKLVLVGELEIVTGVPLDHHVDERAGDEHEH